jgi:two-component system, NarL family, response regulator LiaR
MLPPKPIRVLVADSHEMSRYGLTLFLETFDDLELVGEAQDGMEVLQMCAQLQPDVVLMSLNLKSLNGIETVRMLREQSPQVKVVMLSHLSPPQDLELAMQAGASSFLIKGVADITMMAEAIREAAR